jgi:uncharacterized ParB-like nuclease family protein
MVIYSGNFTKISEIEGEERMLDLKKINLIGFHKGVDKEKVLSMLEAIAHNAQFPPVKVVEINEENYSMCFLVDDETMKPDGGHHRAYAHYLADKKLKVKIVSRKYIHNIGINIREMTWRE